MKLRNLARWARDHWPSIILHTLLFGFLAGLLVWRLGDLTPGYAAAEVATHHASTPLRAILDNPLNAPFTLINHALLYLNQHSLFLARTVSVGVSLVTLAVFFMLVRNWHGPRTAFYGSLLFGTSALFLHTGRLGTPVVLSYLLFLLLAAGFWMKQSKSPWPVFFVCLLASLLLYVPGMIALLVVGAIWQWRTLDKVFKQHLGVVTAGAVVFTAAVAPLAWAFYRTPELIKTWVGLPAGPGWPELIPTLKQIATVPVDILIRNNSSSPETWLGQAPLLDIFSLVMLGIGVIVYCKSLRLRRTQLLVAFTVLILTLIGLGGAVTLVVLLPFIYLMIAGGIYYLMSEWLSVFPRNPFARAVGLGLLSVIVLLAVTFHLRHYFVGWPQARATHQAFTIQKL